MKTILKLAAVSALALTFATDRAHAALQITVNGTNFLIDFYEAPTPSDGAKWEDYTTATPPANALSWGTGTPWFGIPPTTNTDVDEDAYDFAAAFTTAFPTSTGLPPGPIPVEGQAYAFGFKENMADAFNPATVSAWAAVYENGTFETLDQPLVIDQKEGFPSGEDGDINNPISWAYVVDPNFQTPVPEIDGPVLAQVGFALGGLYLVLVGRRRRDSSDMSRMA